jgi:signal transduction histidine kinase
MMTPAAADRRVSLVAPVLNAIPDAVVVCDGLAIQQALINLLDNAIKHSPPDSTVTVGLQRANDLISLWVEDHGPGIPIAEREKIFERFYRRGTELRRETQGIGIGLTILKHIVEAHGGRVIVSGEVGLGSRFTLEFPAHGGKAKA